MKRLNSVENINENNIVILRMDLDLPMDGDEILDNSRLIKSVPTIKLLLERKNKVVVVGHRGRPEGREDRFSLKPIYIELINLLEKSCGGDCISNIFVEDIKNEEEIRKAIDGNELIMIENLRFWWEEEQGEIKLFDVLRKFAKIYVDDAFATAHRKSASIMMHREMENYYGIDFVGEFEKISFILESKDRPKIIVLGGAKKDKLKHLKKLSEKAEWILIGGKLPRLRPAGYDGQSKIIWAKLRKDGLDLSDEDIKKFREKIKEAKMIVWAGAMGFYEKDGSKKGTKEIAKAISNSGAYKIIAGGDTTASIKDLRVEDKIDFICSGGGVMLEFLTKGSLPAWE